MNIILSLDFCLKRFLLKTFRVCLLLLRKVPNSFRWSLAPVACRVTLPLSRPPLVHPRHTVLFLQNWVCQAFSIKEQIVNTLGSVAHRVSVKSIQICCCSTTQPQTIPTWTRLCSNKPLWTPQTAHCGSPIMLSDSGLLLV